MVWKIPSTTIIQTGLAGLLPLITLTEDGKQPEALDAMIKRLILIQDKELLAIAHTIAGLVLKSADDQEMLKRRFAMSDDILQQSWVYQEIKHKGVVEGRAEGQEKEHQMWLESQRETFVNAVKARFPDLLSLALQKAHAINDPLVLQNIMVKLFAVQSLEEAKEILNATA